MRRTNGAPGDCVGSVPSGRSVFSGSVWLKWTRWKEGGSGMGSVAGDDAVRGEVDSDSR
jgi:hypothetical protein